VISIQKGLETNHFLKESEKFKSNKPQFIKIRKQKVPEVGRLIHSIFSLKN
jgi:hypothetical protein